jgi:hypothetical protein
MSGMRELIDTELDSVSGGHHALPPRSYGDHGQQGLRHLEHQGTPGLFNFGNFGNFINFGNIAIQQNITVQIGDITLNPTINANGGNATASFNVSGFNFSF